MRIDRSLYGLNPKDLRSKPAKAGQSGKARGAGTTAASGTASAAETAPASLVSQALATDEVRMQAVEEARMLLQTGQLDTPEAIERTARAIVERGL